MTEKKSVLVVEDNEDLLEIIAFELEMNDFKVFTAINGLEGLAIINSHKVDLILSDIRMPKGDGLTLLSEVRKKDPTYPVFFLMTGYSEISESDCLKKGAQRVFTKPFDRTELVHSIRAAL